MNIWDWGINRKTSVLKVETDIITCISSIPIGLAEWRYVSIPSKMMLLFLSIMS
jgi:hypothetical protein